MTEHGREARAVAIELAMKLWPRKYVIDYGEHLNGKQSVEKARQHDLDLLTTALQAALAEVWREAAKRLDYYNDDMGRYDPGLQKIVEEFRQNAKACESQAHQVEARALK